MKYALADVAWMAGLFEGEGCLSAVHAKDKGIPQWRMSMNMTDHDVMLKVQRLFGGRLYHRQSRRTNHKDKWVWTVTSKQAYALCAAMWKFMGERRREKFKAFMVDFNSRPATNSERVKKAWCDGAYANR